MMQSIMRYRYSRVIPACLLVLTCAALGHHPRADTSLPWDGEVQVAGALRVIVHEGETGAKIALDSLLPDPHLYAVGALVDLSGEVTVVGGTAYLSYPDGTDASRTETADETDVEATLLVASSVPAWREVVTKNAIRFEEIDAEIAKLATAAGLSLDARFPFLMEGSFNDLQWHVIDGRRLPAGSSSHHDHLAAAVKAQLDQATATLIGFYSKSDQGVFTHMGSKTHIHCTLDKPFSSGHVDHVNIPAGTTVKFPFIVEALGD
jgi:alpha-acetolactate decarboxylase